MRHELALRDLRTWLLREARKRQEQRLRNWREGTEAVIDMDTPAGLKTLRSDAWFAYQIDARFLVGFLGWDRGTERAESELARRFWLSNPDGFSRPLLSTSLWRQPESALLKSLVGPPQK